MNILTFDIEEWYVEKIFSKCSEDRNKEYEYYLDNILELLEETKKKGTFFCLGGMAEKYPWIVKKIHGYGHEIGCHSYRHFWLNKMSRNELLEDTKRSVDSLEQLIGEKIISYRAPAFSIATDNVWAFEVLAQCGIKFDSSIFPANREFGGFPNFQEKMPAIIKGEGFELKEFPIQTTNILGHEIAYSGGGYFRFFPLFFIKNQMCSSNYSMTYFHLKDLIQENIGLMSKSDYEDFFKEKGTILKRIERYAKANIGKKKAFWKLSELIRSVDFINLDEANSLIDWSNVKTVNI